MSQALEEQSTYDDPLTNDAAMECPCCIVCSFDIVVEGYTWNCGHVVHKECLHAFLEMTEIYCDTCASAQWYFGDGNGQEEGEDAVNVGKSGLSEAMMDMDFDYTQYPYDEDYQSSHKMQSNADDALRIQADQHDIFASEFITKVAENDATDHHAAKVRRGDERSHKLSVTNQSPF